MSGQFLLRPPESAPETHLRVRLALDGAAEGRELRFVDQRMFGGLSVSAGGAELPPEIAHIARDPLDPEFDDDAFVAKVRRRPPGSSGSCSTRTSSPGSATSTPTRPCGGPGCTASGPGRS